MKVKPSYVSILFSLVLACMLLLLAGCDYLPLPRNGAADDLDEGVPTNGPDADELDVDEPVEEAPPIPTGFSSYYWPWLSHGQLTLSSGEVLIGPDLFESDLGFIAEFTADYSYSGRLIWLVEDSDLFALEWVTLTFNVEYYEEHEWAYDEIFEFEINIIQPESIDAGVRNFDLALSDLKGGFEVVLTGIELGKLQEGSFIPEKLDYVALDLELRVVEEE